MPKVGILFNIDALDSGMYGHAAYKIFFGAVDTRQLGACALSDGDTRATLAGQAYQYCIAVETLDAARIALVRNALSRCDSPALAPLPARFLDEHLVDQEPLVEATRINAAGEVVGTGWVMTAWKETREKHLEAGEPLVERTASVFCSQCGSPVKATDHYCPVCGATQGAGEPRAGRLGATAAPLGWQESQYIYTPAFDISRIQPRQIEEFKRHSLDATFPTALAVLLHFFTIGIFTAIYHGLKHSRLPLLRHDDFSAGKAIGFLFIPFFNLYWIFVFWLRLTDRINFQYRIRNLPDAVPRGLVLTTCVLMVIPYVGLISFFVFVPIISGQIQSACNRLALMNAHAHVARAGI